VTKALILSALSTMAGLGFLLVMGTLVGRTLALLVKRRND